MKTPRDLSGKDLALVLVKKWEYVIIHQTGSHHTGDRTAVSSPYLYTCSQISQSGHS